jgi:protein-S-isoprenylcysteine O-methyltransferase Ste14
MPRVMCISGSIVGLLLVVLFGLDLFAPDAFKPFKGHSMLIDVVMVLAGLILAYLSWATLREQT